ncbi:MAG: type I glyceraldehyde-3-phosphate dehydrogenase [Alphaproteobacteria bacterium]|nr:type I glyceraldehyde-3-phosphate dehydrogenase [Alphaproteobacteria bacterium]
MTLKVAINGFGRIGRSSLRLIEESFGGQIEVVALNASGTIEQNIHLLKFDSVHGRFNKQIGSDSKNMLIEGRKIRMSAERDPKDLDWEGVDLVLECTGAFNNREAASAHLERGAKRVLLSAPGKNADQTIVYGVNHDKITEKDTVISAASCTTNCLAPVAMVMRNAVGIEKGFMTTIHAYTGDQPTLDRRHKDPYRGRAAAMSMIPTTTGAAAAVGLVLPDLLGKLDGSAIRVPIPNVSVVDLKFIASGDTSVDEINKAALQAASGSLNGVLAYDEEAKVSIDYNHTETASNFAGQQTRVDGSLVRVLSWYDNEWGFTNQMLRTALEIGKTL